MNLEAAPTRFDLDVVVVGGGGHVGLPLGISFADTGARVALYDINAAVVEQINRGEMPFHERGAPEVLRRVREAGTLEATTDSEVIARAENVVVVIGTPIDDHLNPSAHVVPDAIAEFGGCLREGQLLVLRSTVYPGVTALVERLIERLGHRRRRGVLPGAHRRGPRDDGAVRAAADRRGPHRRASDRAAALFERLTDTIVGLSPEEAELAKLFTNSWRYIKFATANQFYMMANDVGLDFERDPRRARATTIRAPPTCPGRASPPGRACQGHDAAGRVQQQQLRARPHRDARSTRACRSTSCRKLEQRFDLASMTVGHPGHGVQGRQRRHPSSLAYKLKRILRVQGARGALHRPVRDGRLDARAAGRGAGQGRPADHRRAAPGVRGPAVTDSRSSTSGASSATECACE